MTSLMQSYRTLFIICHDLGFLFQSTNNPIYSIMEILLTYRLLIVTGSNKSRLIANISNVCSTKSRSLTGQEVHIHCIIQFYRTQMNSKDFLTFVQIRQIYMYLTIEASGTQQSLIQYICTVCCRQQDYTTVCPKTIHLSKQLVKRTFTFIITSSHGGAMTTGTSDSINLVYKDDTRSLFLCLTEQVAYTTGTDSHKHFYKIRT